MSQPPRPSTPGALNSQVEAFGQAFDAAVSGAGDVIIDSDGVPTRVDEPDSGQVYANDLELRGVYTGPYNTVSDAPPSLGHLTTPKLQTLETAAVPSPEAMAMARAAADGTAPATSFASVLKVFLFLAVIGAAVVFALKSGLI
jgi:hypothetical protein